MSDYSETIDQPNDFRLGVIRIMPIAASAAPFALALGALASQKGITPLEITLMNFIVFAGAAQFISVELWAEPIPSLTIIGITAMVNLRHILMSASISPLLRPHGKAVSYFSLHFMTDEVWALAMQRKHETTFTPKFFLGCGITLFICWATAVYIGAVAGSVIQDPNKWGIDFAATAIFLALMCGFWEGHRTSLLPWLSAAVVSVASYTYLDGPWYIITGALCAMSVRAIMFKEGENND